MNFNEINKMAELWADHADKHCASLVNSIFKNKADLDRDIEHIRSGFRYGLHVLLPLFSKHEEHIQWVERMAKFPKTETALQKRFNSAKDIVEKITNRTIETAKNNPPSQAKSSRALALILMAILSLAALTGCVTTQKAANEQARDAYWLGQADATKQLYFAKEAAQRPSAEPQPDLRYYAIPVEPVPGVNEVPRHVVIPVEK